MRTIIIALILGLSLSMTQDKYRIVKKPDSTTVTSAIWTVDTVLVKGDPKCNHDWRTVPGGENQKYASAPDSLRMILNPRGERVVQEECILCGRERIKSENIIITKQPNPRKKK